MKLKVSLLVFAAMVISIVFLIFSYGFIEIDNSSGQSLSYKLSRENTDDNKTGSINSSSKKLVRKGSYEALLNEGQRSYFTIVEVKGLFRTTQITPNFKAENERSFIGNNPLPCADKVGSMLISIACGDNITNLLVHTPATATLPSINTKAINPMTGYLEGIVHLKEGNYALVKAPLQSEDQGAPHSLYAINQRGEFHSGIPLNELSEDGVYGIETYKTGFIIYNREKNEVYYFDTTTSKPSKLPVNIIRKVGFHQYSVSTYQDRLLITNSSIDEIVAEGFKSEEDVHSHESEGSERHESEVVIHKGGQTSRYSINFIPDKSLPCGSDKVCVLHEGGLEVYRQKDKKLLLAYRVSDVRDIEAVDNKLAIVRKQEIVLLDVDKQQGYSSYLFGNYQYCGIKTSDTGYILCIVDRRNKEYVLSVDTNASSTDAIDKKIFKLAELPIVSDISIYKNFIHISPHLGEREYDPVRKAYVYRQDTKDKANQAIMQYVNTIGIDTGKYTFVNPFR